jgi:peptidoglycan/LPS O-acetylase OafA/YrhL
VLGNIQALRALAALMVVVVHIYAVESTYLPGRPWTTPFHVLGTYGVDLFFVISGTVMVASTAGWLAEPGAMRRFLLHRMTRIYPPYWIVTALVLVAFLIVPAAVGVHRSAPPNILASFLALPQTGEPLLVVGWTLSYELLFYAAFALALPLERRALPLLTAIWLTAIVLVGALGPHGNPWVRVFGSPINFEFALGIAIGTAIARRAFAAPRTIFVLGVAAVVAVCVATAYSGREFLEIAWWRPFAVGLPMAAVVYGALGLEAAGIIAPRWLRVQGDASYALYLWHVPAIGALGFVFHRLLMHGTAARITIVVGGYALSIAVSLLAYAYLERPLLGVLRRSFDSASAIAGRKAVAHSS